jgi:hypothetical protein
MGARFASKGLLVERNPPIPAEALVNVTEAFEVPPPDLDVNQDDGREREPEALSQMVLVSQGASAPGAAARR